MIIRRETTKRIQIKIAIEIWEKLIFARLLKVKTRTVFKAKKQGYKNVSLEELRKSFMGGC